MMGVLVSELPFISKEYFFYHSLPHPFAKVYPPFLISKLFIGECDFVDSNAKFQYFVGLISMAPFSFSLTLSIFMCYRALESSI